MSDYALGSGSGSASEAENATAAGEPTLAELGQRLAALRENIRRAREQYGLPPIVGGVSAVGGASQRG